MKKKKQEKPEIFAVQNNNTEKGVSRRDFIGFGTVIAAGATAGMMGSCSDPNSSKWSNTTISQNECRRYIQQSHFHYVKSVAISADNTLLLSGCYLSTECNPKIWRLSDGALQKTLSGFPDEIYSVAISPDCHLMAMGCGDHSIKLCQFPQRNLLKSLEGHDSTVNSVTFSPDGSRFWPRQAATGRSGSGACLTAI
ncbi:twin-arginine translocation signal domain-containing protein [bacterium]|nr:twin-arginine translocation signal domain-containing protein [bacterium]